MPSRLLARARLSAASESSGAGIDAKIQRFPGLPSVLALGISGPLDAAPSESVNDEISAALGAEITQLLLDFSRIDNLDSAGIGFLVALQKRMRGRGGDLVLFSMRPKLKKFLETLGFGGFFSIALDLRYALEYIESIQRDIFPVSALCPACAAPLGIDSPGRRRCRACGAVLTALPDGSVEVG
jgi:anti-sigma B factor antagonist